MWSGPPSCSTKLLKWVSYPYPIHRWSCLWFPCQPVSVPVAALPGSLTATLPCSSRAHPVKVTQQFAGTCTALPWKASVPAPGTPLLPHHAWRGALRCVWSSGTPLLACQASSSSYTNSRIHHLFEITQQCLAPCFPCKDSESCSRYQLVFPEDLWRQTVTFSNGDNRW